MMQLGAWLVLALSQSPAGPLGHWRGDGSPADAAGLGFTAVLAPGAGFVPEGAPVKSPNAGSFTFDGKSGMASVADTPLMRLNGDFAVSFWRRKAAHHADWVRLVGKGNGAQRTFGVWDIPGDHGGVKFQIYNQNGQSVLEADTGGMPSIGVWHHFLCTVSVNSAAVYVDGKFAAGGTKSGEAANSADPLTFGHAGYHSFFAGQLDDIRVYNRALSMAEIAYLAEGQGAPEPPSGLAAAGARLTWKPSPTPPPAGTATYYTVKRAKGAGGRFETAASLITATSWTDPLPEAGMRYVVCAVNTGGESAPSNEAK